ncbi:Ger(x)C family spore germination protein [Bacillus marinisedimentorum]|uniref:Ger(x)C family spore germination protein n=1 Tax=Bacillus marinisedimentorum TaxID=1821260 RepID=UPI0007E11244|nr:Ger(x)C family spore germination protein [Bacillus marinisedimentorum]
MKYKWLFIIIPTLLLLSGCWDLQLLKETRLVYGAAFDLEGENVKDTVAIRTVASNPEVPEGNEIVSVTAKTIRAAKQLVDTKISGRFGSSKILIYLIGDEMAKKDIYPLLDVLYRDPLGALSGKVAVTEGKGADMLYMRKKGETLISEHIRELLESEEASGVVPELTLQTVCTYMFDEGHDFMLPYLNVDQENDTINLKGTALFNKETFTGEVLDIEESEIIMLLSRYALKDGSFTKKVKDDDEEQWMNNYISFDIWDIKNDTSFSFNGKQITANVDVELTVNVTEYPEDRLDEPATQKKLNKKLSEILTKEAEDAVKKVQGANSDVFSFGRDLLAFHSDKLEGGKLGDNYFKEMKITPTIKVKIKNTGVLD